MRGSYLWRRPFSHILPTAAEPSSFQTEARAHKAPSTNSPALYRKSAPTPGLDRYMIVRSIHKMTPQVGILATPLGSEVTSRFTAHREGAREKNSNTGIEHSEGYPFQATPTQGLGLSS